jgi:hypothetical protein
MRLRVFHAHLSQFALPDWFQVLSALAALAVLVLAS